MIFKSDYTKLSEFKKKHHREGEFTDEEGVMTLSTGYYLGVTLRVFSRTNSKQQPYTEYNGNQPIIFNIFHDDRSSGHFQSLIQPKVVSKQNNPEIESPLKTVEPKRTLDEVVDDYLERFHSEQEIYKPVQAISVGRMDNIQKGNTPPEKTGKNKSTQPSKENKINPINKNDNSKVILAKSTISKTQ